MKLFEFNRYLGSVVGFYQLIENDLKIIYGYMHKGEPKNNFNKIKNNTLGQIISKLETLDNSDERPFFTANDYKYLKQIAKKRNHWCHKTFLCFAYEENVEQTTNYKRECKLLLQDYKRSSELQEKIEFLRLDCVNNVYKRKN